MAASAIAGINQDQFLKLLLAGLSNQDPMQPMDSNQFLQQISQFANLEGMQNLTANFSEMLQLQQLTQGSTLIGKTIQYDANGSLTTGTVTGLSAANGKIFLQLGATQVGLDQIKFVGPA